MSRLVTVWRRRPWLTLAAGVFLAGVIIMTSTFRLPLTLTSSLTSSLNYIPNVIYNFSADYSDSTYRSNRSNDVTKYDVEDDVAKWYSRSACAGLQDAFVGDGPLFPRCQASSPEGTPVWGPFPYVVSQSPVWGPFPYVGPFAYINNSRNPCWYEGKRLRCIPYFFLSGVSKSGTTDLYGRVLSHPNIRGFQKEPHWFDRKRYHDNKTFEAYVNTFGKLALNIETDIQEFGYSNMITVDASPSYFYDNYEWRQYSGNEGCTEPRVLLASQIRHLNPDVKIVLIFRHPVQRLYSRYLFDHSRKKHQHHNPTPREFHRFVVEGLAKFRDCFNRWSLRHCIYNKTLLKTTPGIRIQENFYSVLLEDWLRIIPRDQILLLKFEEYSEDIPKTLARVHSFLGLKPLDDAAYDKAESSAVRNKGKVRPGAMFQSTRDIIFTFYRPFVHRLAALLGDKRFLWNF